MAVSMSHAETLWRKGYKDKAAEEWEEITSFREESTTTARIKAHARLALYYQEKGNKEKADDHLFLALNSELFENIDKITFTLINHEIRGVYHAREDEITPAMSNLKVAAYFYEEFEKEKSDHSKEAKLLRAETGLELASLVYLPRENPEKALEELKKEVIPRIRPSSHLRRIFGWSTREETDLAAAYHLMSVSYDKIAEKSNNSQMAALALCFESESLNMWKRHPDYLGRVETAKANIETLKEKYPAATRKMDKTSLKRIHQSSPPQLR